MASTARNAQYSATCLLSPYDRFQPNSRHWRFSCPTGDRLCLAHSMILHVIPHQRLLVDTRVTHDTTDADDIASAKPRYTVYLFKTASPASARQQKASQQRLASDSPASERASERQRQASAQKLQRPASHKPSAQPSSSSPSTTATRPLKPCATTYHSLDPLRLAGGLACLTVVKWRLSSATSP